MLSSHNFHMYSMLCPSPPTAQLEAREGMYGALEKSRWLGKGTERNGVCSKTVFLNQVTSIYIPIDSDLRIPTLDILT